MKIEGKVREIQPLIVGNENEIQKAKWWIAPLWGGFKFNLKLWIGKNYGKSK